MLRRPEDRRVGAEQRWALAVEGRTDDQDKGRETSKEAVA